MESDGQSQSIPAVPKAPALQQESDASSSHLPKRYGTENAADETPGSQLSRRTSGHVQQNLVKRADPETRQVLSQDNGRGGAPAVRLDMNLDVDIEMRAKIKGDVTLSILGGSQNRKE
ncbi:hypothetical protein OQA88_5904 [Cercophora sp. LCS_1]